MRRALTIVLAVEGAVLLLALPAAFLPTDWMDAVHRAMGLGELPRAPLVEYLTRSVSALYASCGLAILFLLTDLPRYLPLVRLIAWLHVVVGAGLAVLDVAVGM